MGQLLNEMCSIDVLRGFTDKLITDLFFVQTDVAGNSARENEGVLQHGVNMAAVGGTPILLVAGLARNQQKPLRTAARSQERKYCPYEKTEKYPCHF